MWVEEPGADRVSLQTLLLRCLRWIGHRCSQLRWVDRGIRRCSSRDDAHCVALCVMEAVTSSYGQILTSSPLAVVFACKPWSKQLFPLLGDRSCPFSVRGQLPDGLGALLFSPLSEIPYFGRNPWYVYVMMVFTALQVGAALTPT